MGLPIPPFDPNQPIPNDPFYAPASASIQGESGPLIIGTGLEIDYTTGTLKATGGGGGGGVTAVNTGFGLTGGPITTTGTISLAASGVTAGSHIFSSLTVDEYGRITSISDGASATESALGIVRLATASEVAAGTDSTKAVTSCSLQKKISDSVALTSSVCIASSAAVKAAYDIASNAIPKNVVLAKGNLIGGTGVSTVTALPLGTEGQILRVCTACATGMTWETPSSGSDIPCAILTGRGSLISATSAGTPVDVPVGANGLILTANSACAIGVEWTNNAAIPCAALAGKGSIISASSAGVPLEVSVGADNQILIANSACASGIQWVNNPSIATSCITAKGDLITGTGANQPVAFNIGTDGQVLTACAACVNGMAWLSQNAPIECGILTAKGDLIVATAASTPAALPVGTDGQVLKACATCTAGVFWDTDVAGADIPCSLLTAAGQIVVASGANTPAALPVGNDNERLTACATCANGLYWAPDSSVDKSLYAATGDILVAGSPNTPVALSVGTDGQVLKACAACTNGIFWDTDQAGADIPCSILTATGDIVIGSAANTPAALPVGTDGQVLKACAACATGLVWETDETGADIPCSLLTATGDIVIGTGANTPAALPVGTDGQVLKACAACATGLVWETDQAGADIPCSILTATGDIVIGTGANTPAALPVGTDGQVLKACAACATGLVWETDETGADIPCSILVAKGDIISATAAGTPSVVTVGADGLVLKANSTCASGLEWAADTGSPSAESTIEGIVYGCTTITAGAPVSIGYQAAQNVTGSGITAVGYNALAANTTGAGNTAFGNNALASNQTGTNSVAIGCGALQASVTSTDNTAIGFNSLNAHTSGTGNVAIGSCTLLTITTGDFNTAIGYRAMACNTTGVNNFANGAFALFNNLDGGANTAVGNNALCNNSSGSFNIALGFNAGLGNTTGGDNIAIGGNALASNQTACKNTAIGTCALAASTTGCQNNAIGTRALAANQTGNFNLAVGECALVGNIGGSSNVAVGDNALQSNSNTNNNVAVGSNALATATAANNVAVGHGAGQSVTTGGGNAFFANGGSGLLTGSGNLFLGATGNVNSTADTNCVFIGTNNQTRLLINGSSAFAFGTSGYGTAGQVLQSNGSGASPTWVPAGGAASAQPTTEGIVYGCTTTSGTALGYQAGIGTGGVSGGSVYIGRDAGNTIPATCSSSNIYIGQNAGPFGTVTASHSRTIAIGTSSMNNAAGVTTDCSIAIGHNTDAGGGCSIAIGPIAKARGATSTSNNIAIGFAAGVAGSSYDIDGAVNGAIIMGNCSHNFAWIKIAWTINSDIRTKKVEGEVPLGLPFIKSLETIKYQYCDRNTQEVTDNTYRYGFSAQQVAENEVDPENPVIVNKPKDPDQGYSLTHDYLLPPVVNAIKELSDKIDALQAENDELRSRVAALETN